MNTAKEIKKTLIKIVIKAVAIEIPKRILHQSCIGLEQNKVRRSISRTSLAKVTTTSSSSSF